MIYFFLRNIVTLYDVWYDGVYFLKYRINELLQKEHDKNIPQSKNLYFYLNLYHVYGLIICV